MTSSSTPGSIDFSTFILSLAGSAMVHLGRVPDPTGRHGDTNIEMARQSIDMLVMLRTKTHGNLTPDEAALLERLLHDTRVAFLDEARKQAS